jgi:hypothetical protein
MTHVLKADKEKVRKDRAYLCLPQVYFTIDKIERNIDGLMAYLRIGPKQTPYKAYLQSVPLRQISKFIMD